VISGSMLTRLGHGTFTRAERNQAQVQMRLGVALPIADIGGEPAALREFAQAAEGHCQLKQRWYAPAVGGAVVRCGEALGTPIGLSPSQPRGGPEAHPDSVKLTMPAWLFLPKDLRRARLGSRALAMAEEEGRRRGCTRITMTTLSIEAPGFYLKQGYEIAATIDCEPPSLTRYYMTKKL
jgi:GNAT superfamily N-acetyltransferase